MAHPPVEFYHQAELWISHVVIDVAAEPSLASLPLPGWKAVRALDSPQISKFKQRLSPRSDISDGGLDLPPPTHSLSRFKTIKESFGCREAPRTGRCQPADRLVERTGDGGEIKRRSLDPCLWRHPDRVAISVKASGAMQDHIRQTIDAAAVRDSDMYRIATFLAETG